MMFKEFFLYCRWCDQITRFACSDDDGEVNCECEECEHLMVFADWEEVLKEDRSQ